MGYRSDVRITMSKRGFEQFKENVKNNIEKYKKTLAPDSIAATYEYNLLSDIDLMSDPEEEQVYIGWNDVKWYDGYASVDAIMDALYELDNQGYGYGYARIGESTEDIEEIYHDATENDDLKYLEYPGIIRQFNDDYLLNPITNAIEPEMEI